MATDDNSDGSPELGSNNVDRATAVARTAAGMIPVVGPVLAELVNSFIPNQRLDRVEKYLRYLAEELEKRSIRDDERIKNPNDAALVEDGGYQAARAVSEDRLRYIAKCVAEGLSADAADKLNERRVLNILSELDDRDILILSAYASNDWGAFAKLRPPRAHLGSKGKGLADYSLYEHAISRLETLGLLYYRVSTRIGQPIPEFDSVSGRPKGHHGISALGREVLRRIGLSVGK